MFDSWRNRGSAAEKRQEALGAYLDNALTPAERRRFEQQLARDASLRAELEQMRALKLQMRAMPRRRVPRSFALNPALYGRPKAQPMLQLYPVLRGATALTAFLLIFTLALGAFRGRFVGGGGEAAPAAEFAVSEAAEEAPAAAEESAALTIATEPAETARAAPTRAASTSAPELGAGAAEPAPDLAAQAVITEEFAVEEAAEAAPPLGTLTPEGTVAVAVPEAELGLETTAPTAEPTVEADLEATATAAEPMVEAVAEAMATSVASVENADAADEAAAPAEEAPSGTSALLRPLQIGLAVAFVVLLVLWLVARRRVRSL